MTRHIRRLIVPCFCLACAAPALANSFSLYYEADGTFPEQEGWSHWTNNPEAGVERTVEDGVFRLNSMASPDTADLYAVWGSDLMPGPGEFLRVDWRMRVLQQQDDGAPDWFGDAGMHIARSYGESAPLNLAPDLISALTPGHSGYQVLSLLEPGAWHAYSFLTDMEHYDLFVDDRLVFHSALYSGEPNTPAPYVSWGDPWTGAGSESEWDYVQVSIVPEPGATLVAIAGAVLLSRTARKGA